MAAATQTVQEELASLALQLQAYETQLADAYVAGELAKAQGDTKGLESAQKRIAESLAGMEPLRARRFALEEQQKVERAARQRAQKEVRLNKFRTQISPVLPKVMERIEAHQKRIMAHVKGGLDILEEGEYLRMELARIQPEIEFVRDNYPDEDPLRPRLQDWGQMELGRLPIRYIVMGPGDIAMTIDHLQSLANTQNGAKKK